MISKVLLVYPDSQRDYFEDLRGELGEAFKDDEGNKPAIIVEQSVMRAKESIQDITDIDLVVSYVELQPEPRSVPDPDGAFMLEDWLRKNDIKIPMVIIVPKLNNAIAQRSTDPLSRVWENSRSLCDTIISFVQKSKSPEKKIIILLNLQGKDDNAKWHYTIKGKDFPGWQGLTGDLKKPDSTDLGNILQGTKNVDDRQTDDWKGCVELLSNNLYKILIEQNNQFQQDLNEAVRQVGKLEQTRVQFIVDKKLYPVFLEAVPSPEANPGSRSDDYWMFHSPVVRHVSKCRAGLTLFQKEERRGLNILIIGSDITGWTDLGSSGREPKYLDKLPNVALECDELKQHMKELKNEERNLGEIRVIPSSSTEKISTEEVKRVLNENRWDIVHYAGHSYLDEETGCAYVFFMNKDNKVDPVKIEEFAGYLRNTRLLVLSSCTSSHERFVFELAKHQVPAVLGFRTSIDDDLARQFSIDFYRRLFDMKSVDGAFFMARKQLYKDNVTDRAWTNPVLVLESIG
jgi:hypothetical protein